MAKLTNPPFNQKPKPIDKSTVPMISKFRRENLSARTPIGTSVKIVVIDQSYQERNLKWIETRFAKK
jgi:hypothetical protein